MSNNHPDNFVSIPPAHIEDTERLTREIPQALNELVVLPWDKEKHNIGVYLSGGVDSAIVLYHLTQLANGVGQKILTYTANFGLNKTEGVQAKNIAEHFGSIHKEVPIENLYPSLIQILQLFDKPRFNIWPYFLAKAAKQDFCKWIFIGEGSDEIFGGYTTKSYLQAWADDIIYIMSTYEIIHDFFKLELTAPFMQLDWRYFLPIHHNPNKKYLREAYRGLIPDWIINYPSEPPAYTNYQKLWQKEFAPYFANNPESNIEARLRIQKVVMNLWLQINI